MPTRTRFMECIFPRRRVSRNSFALVVCNEPVGADAGSWVCTSLPWCSQAELSATTPGDRTHLEKRGLSRESAAERRGKR
ncbi:hypothetical protein EYF80_002626 [Liparis tanakae]|uniref:Uncharacterized protein n=1 Tax=Liparis tanakae TaxID=230148 RepID=A0A4Z2JAA5_9TELE|nr:hypothetical protein EYF80_002626 [Liparis tanakae]